MNRPTAYGTLLALPIAAGLLIYSWTSDEAPSDGGAATERTTERTLDPGPRRTTDGSTSQSASAATGEPAQPATQPNASAGDRPEGSPPVLRPEDVRPPTMGPAPAPVNDPILAKMIESFSMDRLRDEGFWDMGRPGERERALALAARIPVESGEIAESFNTALSRHWRERIDTVGVAAARQERAASTLKPIDPDSLPRRR